jgi:hypothetical protein
LHLVCDLFELSQVVLSLSTLIEHLPITDPETTSLIFFEFPNFMEFTTDRSLIQLAVVNTREIPVEYDTDKLLLIKANLCVTTVYRIIQSHRETTGRIRYRNDSNTIFTTRLHIHVATLTGFRNSYPLVYDWFWHVNRLTGINW